MQRESFEPSYYEVLGIDEDATSAEVGKAFMRAMRTAHPDHHQESAESLAAAQEHARLLTQAHQVLFGEGRSEYDRDLRDYRARAQWESPAGPHAPGWESSEGEDHAETGEATDGDEPAPPEEAAAHEEVAEVDGPGEPGVADVAPTFWDAVAGSDQEAVLRLPRDRWERGGTLAPLDGSQSLVIPERVDHGEVLVFTGRGRPSGGAQPAGDLLVRVLHVDSRGRELPQGHGSGTGRDWGLVGRVSLVVVVASALIVAILALG